MVPVLAVIAYPWLLRAFHSAMITSHHGVAAILLAMVFAVPLIGGLFAAWSASISCGTVQEIRLQRLAYICIVAPTLFVFLGVVQTLMHSSVPEEVVWIGGWTCLAIWAWSGSPSQGHLQIAAIPIRWRMLHGISGAVLLVYVLFHVGNHLFGLEGPEAHAAVMKAGRRIYRAPLIEPILVGLMILQVVTGCRLAWRWSALPADARRVVQITSGLYLSVFILGHMNSVFIYARTVLNINTGWDFATGAPTGLLNDAWNIRLLPHYALGVFFALAHLTAGARIVMIAHGVNRKRADQFWNTGMLVSLVLSAAIIAGLCGARI